ncbi:NfeD family protein [Halopiger aswanensis]|uniref:Membrane protein implicated in regulation of membrane protease activity n=1 Tax=Halopiger aswanensis TaxID=148449 RepID=A0A3R7DA42_9EURY|nr:NfeD family protein [Halopiger aswanensis]RKD95296.1 membrane protein implicated in regulation of membrane protease activity [Halopiger aswanensis]
MLDALLGNVPLLLLSVGLVLMLLEALSPGAHLIVIGVALVGAGLIGMLVPLTLSPIVLAALTLVIGLAAAYVYREFDFYGGKGTAQTTDSDSLAGATGYATERITTRDGEVKLDEGGFAPYYSARTSSGTIEEGEEIIVIDPGGGNVLTVESLGAIGEDEIDRALAKDAANNATNADSNTSADTGSPLEDSGNANANPERETETEKSS